MEGIVGTESENNQKVDVYKEHLYKAEADIEDALRFAWRMFKCLLLLFLLVVQPIVTFGYDNVTTQVVTMMMLLDDEKKNDNKPEAAKETRPKKTPAEKEEEDREKLVGMLIIIGIVSGILIFNCIPEVIDEVTAKRNAR